jgi:hypothetical protein
MEWHAARAVCDSNGQGDSLCPGALALERLADRRARDAELLGDPVVGQPGALELGDLAIAPFARRGEQLLGQVVRQAGNGRRTAVERDRGGQDDPARV